MFSDDADATATPDDTGTNDDDDDERILKVIYVLNLFPEIITFHKHLIVMS